LFTLPYWFEDAIKVCYDMEVCAVRPHLWLTQDPWIPGMIFKPMAPYVLK
jgi:hypothetical protein